MLRNEGRRGEGRHGFDGAWIEPGTLPALAASALFGSVLVFGVASRLVRYRGDQLNGIFAALVVLWPAASDANSPGAGISAKG